MIESVLALILAVAIAIERIVEIIKPVYLKAKNAVLKKQYPECTRTEKIIMSVITGPAICLALGLTADVPGIPAAAQSILLGLIASVGSNVIHTLISTITAIKDATESLKKC
jgi:Na+-translocating ferredoxin:NAD+ oxidoreductase RnfA subunit